MKSILALLLVMILSSTAFVKMWAMSEVVGGNETNQTGPPSSDYKYWLIFPDHSTLNCTNVYCTNEACEKPANATGDWCPIAFPWDFKVYERSSDPSFQYGFKTAVTWYKGFFSTNNDDDWDRPNINSANDTCQGDSSHHITNMTTCTYGWVQGFRQWCSTDTKNCAEAAADGELPREILHIFNY